MKVAWRGPDGGTICPSVVYQSAHPLRSARPPKLSLSSAQSLVQAWLGSLGTYSLEPMKLTGPPTKGLIKPTAASTSLLSSLKISACIIFATKHKPPYASNVLMPNSSNTNNHMPAVLFCPDKLRHKTHTDNYVSALRSHLYLFCISEWRKVVSFSNQMGTFLSDVCSFKCCVWNECLPTMSCLQIREHGWAEGCAALTMERPGVQNTWNDLEPQHSPFPWLQGRWVFLWICTCVSVC